MVLGGRAAGMLPILALAIILTVPAVGAQGGSDGWTEHAVLGRVHDHPDVGFSPSLAFFPPHDDVIRRIDALADHPWMTVHELGTSGEGRAIRVVEVTDPESDVPVDERVVTLLLTQQHGNEPAGTPAALRLLEDIADGGPISQHLDNQVLLVLPMANPDGAEAAQRGNAAGTDTNRDHNHLETAEGRTMHEVLSRWRVHVALDHHEYGGTGLGNPFPVRIYDYDLTTLFPTHASVHPEVLFMAKSLMYDAIWPAAEENGYTVGEYGVLTLHGIPLEQLAGGPDPGILRNHWGIHHIAGILIETRIDAHPNPLHDALRREEIHHVTMTATLGHVSAHAGLFIAARADAEREHATAPPQRYRESADTADAAVPPAYLLQGDAAVFDLLARHGIPAGVNGTAGLVHKLDHAWPVHSAALFDAASSRRVLEGTATEALPAATMDDPLNEERVPAVGAALLVGALSLLAIAAMARTRRGP